MQSLFSFSSREGKRVTAAAPSESGQRCKLGTHFYTVTVCRLNQYKETDSHYLGQRQAELQQHINPGNKAWDPPKSSQLRSVALKAQELQRLPTPPWGLGGSAGCSSSPTLSSGAEPAGTQHSTHLSNNPFSPPPAPARSKSRQGAR